MGEENKEIYVATNFLERMITITYQIANDIYNSLEMGASGIVLAAETAIGVNPEKCVNFIKSLYAIHKKIIKKLLISILFNILFIDSLIDILSVLIVIFEYKDFSYFIFDL